MKLIDKKTVRLILCVLFFALISDVYAIKSYSFITVEPQLVIYPNEYQNSAKKRKTRLIVLANEINKRSKSDIIEFVKISLTEMAFVYHEESIRAKEDSLKQDDKEKRKKLIRWSQNALLFANQTSEIEKSINQSTDIELFIESYGELYFLVNDRPVLISSPVLNGQKILEERIIKSACSRFNCDMEKLESYSGPDKRKIHVNAGWKLKEDKYIFYTRSGLNFVFQTIGQKKYKQRICLKIARDLNLIAMVLRDISKTGVFIDWEYLYIQVIPGGNLYELIVNQFKDAVHLELETIQFLNDFPEVAIPWLKERIKKEKKEFYFHKAEKLILELVDNKKSK